MFASLPLKQRLFFPPCVHRQVARQSEKHITVDHSFFSQSHNKLTLQTKTRGMPLFYWNIFRLK